MNDLVVAQKGKAITTSLLVAEKFGKQHKNVLRAIDRLVESLPAERRLIFQPSSYTNEQDKPQPMYFMDRDGYSLLAMGFTGKKALEFKLKFIDAFNKMEQSLLQQQNLSWKQARLDNKTARRIETDTISEFVDYATSQGSKNAQMYYMNITKMTHKALFMVKSASPKPFRDMLDSMQLTFLTGAEYVCQKALDEGMKQGLHYKEIYSLARDKVTTYAATLPQVKMVAA